MNFEPQKLFIGLVDFFSILMPGALLTYLGKDWATTKLGVTKGLPLDSTEAVFVFLFASYLLGHFAFLISSTLDDWVYDPLRGWTAWGQISRHLAQGRKLSPLWRRNLAMSNLLFHRNADTAVMQAQRIKARTLDRIAAESSINTFQWCKARLTKDLPDGLLAVQRFEADSKFFRSFVVVLTVLMVFYAVRSNWVAAICGVAVLPAMWRYIDQRFKATQQGYWFVITLEAMRPEPTTTVPRSDGLTHSGGVVYRGRGASAEFMLVQASRDRSQWVLPKGHIEPGEAPRATAVREVQEESGHWARIVRWLEDAPLTTELDAPVVRWFLMELAEETVEWPPENRQRVWLHVEDAKVKASFPESRRLLEEAARGLSV
jgi:8-oxo-dGTP pyrophosphatase MutT (NUDIX family)